MTALLLRQDSIHVQQREIERLCLVYDLAQRSRFDLISDPPYQNAMLSFGECFDGSNPESSGEQPVKGCWRSAPLHMAEDGCAQLVSKPALMFAEILKESLRVVMRALGDNGEYMLLAAIVGRSYQFDERFGTDFAFRYDNRLRAARQAHHQGKVTAMPSHYFHEQSPVMRGCGDFQPIDSFERNVQSSVHTNRDVRTAQVIVDGRCDADYREVRS